MMLLKKVEQKFRTVYVFQKVKSNCFLKVSYEPEWTLIKELSVKVSYKFLSKFLEFCRVDFSWLFADFYGVWVGLAEKE